MSQTALDSPQVAALVDQIESALPRAGSIDAATDQVRRHLDALMPGMADQLAGELTRARAIVETRYRPVEHLTLLHTVGKRRPPWYFGSRPGDRHWPALKGYLLGQKRWLEDDVTRLDLASDEVVASLESPRQDTFSCRGLVVGHVQSGKTANMAAVIAKALDAGYNTVIVLAGMTNKLRSQTQLRLCQDLVNRHPLDWQVLTSNEVDRDFRAPAHGGLLAHIDKAQLAVVKKNVSPLNQLKIAIERTMAAVLSKLKILIIDDECDQASVNSASGELDITAINRHIRELIANLPSVSYVGYTATPFANVLINPYRTGGQDLDDLYPRDFITALPSSPGYFGTERLFGRPPTDPADPQPEEEGLDMIRPVPPEDETMLQPASQKERNSFHPRMPDSLKRALLYFFACCAARRARGDASEHMTMLIHTSAFVVAHERLAALVNGWVDVNRGAILDPGSDVGKLLSEVWEDEHGRLSSLTDAPQIGVDDVRRHLADVLAAVQFPVENGSSDDRIDYGGPPRTYVVVGGSILARGLTLEGLVVSYFLRTANQYDTLLQMGRWFGYRMRYEDLPRIWMPTELRKRFRSLATIEREIREEIEQYRIHELTPLDVAVRIRSIPGIAITSASKMREHVRRCAVSYWHAHKQTTRFACKDQDVLGRNWRAAEELIARAEELGLRDRDTEKKLWRRVPLSSVVRFFNQYAVHPSNVDLSASMLLPFLQQADDRLAHWNVAIVESGDRAGRDFARIGHISLMTRSRLDEDSDIADIKALMSKTDILMDCTEVVDRSGDWDDFKRLRKDIVGDVPLLLLYPIDRVSAPRRARPVSSEQKRSPSRVALDAVDDVMGFGVVFPGSVADSGNYVAVELRTLSADEVDAILEEEAEQAEAAGVH